MDRILNGTALVNFKEILQKEGFRPALVYLNRLTQHRFSALYEFRNETLHNRYFVDRENLEIETTDEISVTASYCVFLRDTGALFHTSDALRDGRMLRDEKMRIRRD